MEVLRNDDLSVICSFLTAKEMSVFGRVCHKTYHACTERSDWVWHELALRRWLFCRVDKYRSWLDLYARRSVIEQHMQRADKFKMIPCRGHAGYITVLTGRDYLRSAIGEVIQWLPVSSAYTPTHLSPHSQSITHIQMSPGGTHLLTVSAEGHFKTLSLVHESGSSLREVLFAHFAEGLYGLNRTVVAGNDDRSWSVVVFDVSTASVQIQGPSSRDLLKATAVSATKTRLFLANVQGDLIEISLKPLRIVSKSY